MPEQERLLFIYPDWPASSRVQCASSTRHSGYSQGAWRGFNLAEHVGDDPDHVQANRKLLIQSLGLLSEPHWLKQVHGCDVWVGDTGADSVECDASVAFGPGQICAVLTADCLPVLLCSRSGDRVAAVHAGWRGLAEGVIEKTVLALGGNGENMMAWLGPAIGPQAFEVGVDVYEAFVSQDANAQMAFTPHADRWLCDIYRLARLRLNALGIQDVFGGDLCTYSDEASFYSYRRDGLTGRMASLIWIK